MYTFNNIIQKLEFKKYVDTNKINLLTFYRCKNISWLEVAFTIF